jgi:type I restriction enzyme, S subunit
VNNYRLKSLVTCPVEKSDGEALPFVGLEDVGSGTGALATDELPMYRPGNVLFSKLRPYLAKSFMPTMHGSATGELLVLRPQREIDSRFLLYCTLSSPWLEWAETTSYGTKMPRTSWEAMSEYRLPLPSLDEQRRIANFLDTETEFARKIEALRSQQKERLEKRRWSLLLDLIENSASEDLPLRRLLHSVTDGPFGSAFSSSDYADNGAAVVRLGNIGFAEYRPQDQAYIPMNLFREFRRYNVSEGDILIAGLGDPRNHAGRACIAPDLGPAIVKGKCFRSRAVPGKASAEFITLILSSPIGASALEGRGSTRSMINLEILKSAVFPIPSYSDQVAITTQTNDYWQSAQTAIQACDRQLALLTERRQALITAAVTGGITV